MVSRFRPLRVAPCVLVLALAAGGADWDRFRGPNGTGVEETSGLPAEFGPSRNVVWKTPLPPGHSSPILSGDRIFLTAVEDERLWTISLARATGEILWRRECPRPRRESLDKRNHPASPTPAADGRHVYVFFPDFGLVSYDFAGKERWRAPLGPFRNLYGMGASPVLAGDSVVQICDQSTDSFAIAYGRDDGLVRWRTPRPEAVSGHSTPVLYRPADGSIQVLAPGSFRLDAYSAATGESLWWVRGLASEMKSVPVLDRDTIYVNGYNTPDNDPGRLIAVAPFAEVLQNHDADGNGRLVRQEMPDARTRSFFEYIDLDRSGAVDEAEWKKFAAAMAAENGLLAIRAGGQGDTTSSAVRWKYQRSVPQLPSTLLYQGVLYMINDGGVLTTLDPAAGMAHKQARLGGVADRYFASPVAGDGKVYFLSHTGVATVLAAGGEQRVLAANQLDEECFATPALAGGRIYLRTRGALYCFGRTRGSPSGPPNFGYTTKTPRYRRN